MDALFLCGPLAHEPLLALILGRRVQPVAARLAGHGLGSLADGTAVALIPAPGQAVAGVVLRDLASGDLARLDHYCGGGLDAAPVLGVTLQAGPLQARVWPRPDGAPQGLPPWDAADWMARHAAETLAMAADIMALQGARPAAVVAARQGQMRVRGAARVRAADPAPATRRHAAAPADVQVVARREPYANFFAVEEQELRFRRFDGTLSPQVNRAAFLSGDAVTVLPYDPQRDRVLLVEQFRFGPHARGDANPWQMEIIAGRIDPGETPEAAARREAAEEAGLRLDRLIPIAQYYSTPGAYAEFLYAYLALTDLPDGVEGVFGVEGEAEDIRGHLLTFEALMALVASGEVGNGPTILSALWLARERPRLRG